ncbi:MAG: hypothetical protein ACRDDX_14045 [Cellulosilyticaceae bacterium]
MKWKIIIGGLIGCIAMSGFGIGFYIKSVNTNKNALQNVEYKDNPNNITCKEYVTSRYIDGFWHVPLMFNAQKEGIYSINHEKEQEVYELSLQDLQKISTELMACTGPEVIRLEGLPYETYIDKGVLKPIPVQDYYSNQIHPNIKRLCTYDNQLKILPYDVQLLGLYVNQEVLLDIGMSWLTYDLERYDIEGLVQTVERVKDFLPEEVAIIPKESTEVFAEHLIQLLYYDTIKRGEQMTAADIRQLIDTLRMVQSWEHKTYTIGDMLTNERGEREQVLFILMNIWAPDYKMQGYGVYPSPHSRLGYTYIRPNYTLGVTSVEKQGAIAQLMMMSISENGPQSYNTYIPANHYVLATYREKAQMSKNSEPLRQIDLIEKMLDEADGWYCDDMGIRLMNQEMKAVLANQQTEEKAVANIINYMKTMQVK